MLGAVLVRRRAIGLLALLTVLGGPPAALAQDRAAPQTRAARELQYAEEIYEEALRKRQEGDREGSDETLLRAERRYRVVLDLDRDNTDAAVRLSTILFATNRSAEAVPFLQAALQRKPNETRLKHQLGISLFAVRRGREGRPLLEEATRENPDLYDAHLLLARYRYETVRDYDAAVASYQAYLRARPAALSSGDAGILGAIGNAYLAAQRYPEARAQYQRVIALDDRNIPARINLAYSYYMEGNYAEAVTRYESIIRLGDPPAVVLANLSRSLFKLGRVRPAINRAQQLQRLRGNSHLGYLVEAEILTASGNARAAVPKIRIALERAPRDITTLIASATTFQAVGDPATAQRNLETARRIDPNNMDVVAALATLYRRGGRDREALALYERVAAEKPRDADAQYGIGACHYALGDDAAAMTALQAALERRPNHAAAKSGLALTHNRAGVRLLERDDAAGAQAAFERALAVDSSCAPAHRNLGEILLRQGNAAAALPHLERPSRAADPDGAYLLGRAYLALGRAADAVPKLRAATGGHLPAQQVGLALGIALSLQNEHDEAVTILRRAVGAQPARENARLLSLALWRRAVGHLSAGRDRQAISDLEAAEQNARSLNDVERERLNLSQAIAMLSGGDGRRALPILQRLRGSAQAFLAPPYNQVGLDYFVMYGRYLANDYRAFFGNLRTVRARAPAALTDNLARLEINARIRSAEALFSRGSHSQAAGEMAQLRHLGGIGANDGLVRLADACLEYARGRRAEAGAVFAELARRVRGTADADVPREALFDLAIYLEQVRRDHQGAAQAYTQYIAARGRHSDVARKQLERKQRVLGIGGDPP